MHSLHRYLNCTCHKCNPDKGTRNSFQKILEDKDHKYNKWNFSCFIDAIGYLI